jgi:WhiB family redox-sensing transcriptional regulator
VTWQSADEFLAANQDLDYEPDLDELIDYTPPSNYHGPEWHQDALCVGAEEKTFFGARDISERPAISMSDIARAKAICIECPVMDICLATALGLEGENREEYGIWAGTSGRTRKRIWHLVDEEGQDLEEIYDDILGGNLAAYERALQLVPTEARLVPSEFNREAAA